MADQDRSEGLGKRFRFGSFEADLSVGELRKNGRLIRLQVQPFLVLVALLERPGEVVTRDELRKRLWPEDTFGEFDQGLNTAINKLREALGDSATSPKFIETLPKRGYRFTHPIDGDGLLPSGANATPSAPRRKWGYALAAAAVALMAALLSITWVRRQPFVPQLPLRRFTIRAPVTIGGGAPWDSAATVSPDGKHIAFAEQGRGGRLWIQDLDQQSPRVLADTEGGKRPFWSPDSSLVGYASGGELRKIPVSGGASIRLCPRCANVFFGGTWSPDGRSIVFGEGNPSILYEIPATGGERRVLWSPREIRFRDASGSDRPYLYSPHFLPLNTRGRNILFSFGYATSTTLLKNVDTGHEVILGQGNNPVYSPTGHILYRSLAEIWAQPFSLERLTPTGERFRVAHGAANATVTADGTLVYMDTGQEKLVWRDRRGVVTGSVGQPVELASYPALSPDGRSAAVETLENGNLDIWVYDLDRGARVRLTSHAATDIVPVWSPSGDTIAFSSYRFGGTDVFLRSANASGETKPIAAKPNNERVSDWSRDGRYILYSLLDPTNGNDIWYLERNGDGQWEPHPYLQTPSNESAAKISPDGRHVAYVSDETGRNEVYVRPFPHDDRNWPISVNGGIQVRWKRDGRELYYVEGNTLMVVPIRAARAFTPGAAKRLFSNLLLSASLYEANYDVSADGERFLLPQPADGTERNIQIVQNWFAEFRK